MTTISSRLTAIAEDVASIGVTKTAIKDAIATNLGRTVPEATTFNNFKNYILPPVAWMPDPLWASLDDIADGQIGMIVRDRDDLGVAARCAFTVTATAAYVVDWGDGTAPETVASTVMADHTYTLGAGTADSKGTTTFKVRISSTGTITRILMASNVTGGVVKQTVQSVSIKAAGITSMESAFRFCYMMQSCTFVDLPLCATLQFAYSNCIALNSIGDINFQSCTTIANMAAECVSIESIGNITVPICTTMSSFVYLCQNLKSIGSIYAPLAAVINSGFDSCRNLQTIPSLADIGSSADTVSASNAFISVQYTGVINLINAKLSKIGALGLSTRRSNITGLTFSASSAFGGTSPQIDVSYTMMNRTALVALFNLLPTLVGKTINITGCIGTADLTAGDRAIATGKGWTITG